MLLCAVMCCAALCCAAVYYAVLCCAVLCFAVLCCFPALARCVHDCVLCGVLVLRRVVGVQCQQQRCARCSDVLLEVTTGYPSRGSSGLRVLLVRVCVCARVRARVCMYVCVCVWRGGGGGVRVC